MREFPKWSDVRDGIVAVAGGEAAVADARRRQQTYVDAYGPAERPTALGLSQSEAAEHMT